MGAVLLSHVISSCALVSMSGNTAATTENAGAAALHSTGSSPRESPPFSFWIDLYSFLALGLILVYFGLMVFVGAELLDFAYYLIRRPVWNFGIVAFARAALAVGIVILLIRLVPHLIYAAAALVTTTNESVPEAAEGVELQPEQFPRIFALIERVARDVGAPVPDEIRINSAPETLTVELRQFGFTTQRRLVMVLSLPQLAVLSVAELQVILAHELSHFRDTWVRVFLSRFVDFLQRSVAAMEHRWWRWIDPIYWLDRFYFRMAAMLAAPVERHQELRADCLSAAAYGGDLAARTLLKDFLLGNQFLAAEASFQPDGEQETIFAWFRQRWRDFSPDGQDYLLRRLEAEEKSSFWDPDPTYSQRVQLMRSYPAKGPAASEPARELFDDFPNLERRLHDLMFA
jgi:Zn-dependent protease with chaperone function